MNRLLTSLLVVAGFACSAPPAEPPARETAETRDIDTLEERIVELVDGHDGGTHVGFERSSRWYRIDPERSPRADQLLERARRALESGTPVRATIDFTGTRVPKAPRTGADVPFPTLLELELVP